MFDPAVVTVGRITAGTTNNVIPETAEIEGTIRAVSEHTRAKVHDGIRRVAEGIAAAHGCERRGRVIDIGYPVTVNDDRFAEFAARRGRATWSAPTRSSHCRNPVMGAEDFSYVLQNVPGAMMFLGGTPPDRNPATAAPNHSNRVYFDEAAMGDGHRRSTPRPRCNTCASLTGATCLSASVVRARGRRTRRRGAGAG